MKRFFFSGTAAGSLLTALLILGCQVTDTPSSKPNDESGKPKAATPANRQFNDAARFLAGLPPEDGSLLKEASADTAFAKYSAAFEKNWSGLDMSKLDPMRKWSEAELKETAQEKQTLFYPFAGPDFLHAFTFFPGSEHYALIALEKAGSIPKIESMTPAAIDQLFASVNHSLESVVSFSFFKTDNMKVDLKKEVDGTLPILMIFLARTGNRIHDIKRIEIDGDGNIVPSSASVTEAIEKEPALGGVEIVFETPGNTALKKLDYLAVNIDNDHLKKSPAFLKYVEKLGPVNTYLKSASYLMHKSYFSAIRGAILDHSAFVLEDDSAIPFRYFTPDKWNVSLYGVYTTPIDMFKEQHQPDLAAAYKKSDAAKPLSFGIGYRWRVGQSNLLAAKRKS